MKIWRLAVILLIGLLTAILIYPILHEGGHALASILCGAKICEIQFLPISFIICETDGTSVSGMVVIGLGGMLFPLLLSWIIYAKNFWVWLMGLYLNFICLLSFAISLYGCIKFMQGNAMVNEDITKVLELCPEQGWLYLIVLLILIIGVSFQIMWSKPMEHCCIGDETKKCV